MSNKQNRSSMGYYIALGLCAVVIGVSGYLFSLRDTGEDPNQNDPNQTVAGTLPGDDLPVVATKPHQVLPTIPTDDPTEGFQPTVPTVPEPLKTASPVEGQTVAVYAMDALSYNQTTRDWRTHDGLDIAAEPGTQVCAAADGVVYTVFEDDTMGMTVVIRHADGYITQYSSLSQEVLVAPGDEVKLGQAIGTVGTTALLETALGHHVHFSVTQDGDAVDPARFLNLT
ncbi:MAG: M23 family metallopeptidase [Oscillospiraceae bacterium]|nr:M23 family metallopeptidase [Oscillospiraceae bacterium]